MLPRQMQQERSDSLEATWGQPACPPLTTTTPVDPWLQPVLPRHPDNAADKDKAKAKGKGKDDWDGGWDDYASSSSCNTDDHTLPMPFIHRLAGPEWEMVQSGRPGQGRGKEGPFIHRLADWRDMAAQDKVAAKREKRARQNAKAKEQRCGTRLAEAQKELEESVTPEAKAKARARVKAQKNQPATWPLTECRDCKECPTGAKWSKCGSRSTSRVQNGSR